MNKYIFLGFICVVMGILLNDVFFIYLAISQFAIGDICYETKELLANYDIKRES